MDPIENLMKNKDDMFFPGNHMCDMGTFLPKILGDSRRHLKAMRGSNILIYRDNTTISTKLSLVLASI